jgi:hypothetical protein
MDVGREEAPGIRVVYYVDDIVVYGEAEQSVTNYTKRWRARLEATWMRWFISTETNLAS